jgi:type IV pilus assembly protein PilO
MADFARMPTQRKVMVFAVIGLVIGAVYWKFVYKSLDDDLAAAQAEHDNKLSTNKRLADDIPRFSELRTHMARLHELIEKNQTALPSEAELPAFFDTLQQKIAESGVEMHKWTNRSEEAVESFVKVPVEIEITGTFMQIKRFFASLIQADVRPSQAADRSGEEHERIVSIENLALGNPTVKNREIILDAKFTAVTFRKEDKPAPAKGPNGQPAAAGAAPPQGPRPAAPPPSPSPSPSPAPPPLPSAATPAGAKARVDKATDKADARNRKAGVNDVKPPAAGSDRLKGGL